MRIMKSAHPSYQRGHINMFSTKTIRQLLHEIGYTKTSLFTYSLKIAHLYSFMKRKKDVREEVFSKIDRLPKEGGTTRFFYYHFVVPSANTIAKLFRGGDYLEVFATK